MQDQIDKILTQAMEKIKQVENSKLLDEIRVQFLGKKGELTSLLKNLGSLSAELRPKMGALVNEAKQKVEAEIEKMKQIIIAEEMKMKFSTERIDVTLPGRVPKRGYKHPLRIVQDEIEEIFLGMGFEIAEGPEIDTDYHNFKALNFGDDHPARDEQDTLYIDDNLLMRTHTSPVQVRTMQQKHPDPIRVICPGRVFRRDTIDATHSPQFHQVEGLIVDKGVRFSDLIGVLKLFAQKMFGQDREIRLRPSFFPFTEPSAEVDVSCMMCGGQGCSFCGKTGWLEILGSGAVHPNVLKMSGYDPEIYTGYAFGMGVERIALLKYRINDIRLLFENDVRFLHQFK
ncbi:MAG: phenylalanine--tRNA ligase subunit alpha [Spirochaetes bacterium]|nr:phenylalanine--tRNA ligase subunit alpha [Spirochaetota bacterium]